MAPCKLSEVSNNQHGSGDQTLRKAGETAVKLTSGNIAGDTKAHLPVMLVLMVLVFNVYLQIIAGGHGVVWNKRRTLGLLACPQYSRYSPPLIAEWHSMASADYHLTLHPWKALRLFPVWGYYEWSCFEQSLKGFYGTVSFYFYRRNVREFNWAA